MNIEYFEPISIAAFEEDEIFCDKQLGKTIHFLGQENFNIDEVDIVLIGVKENRGQSIVNTKVDAADIVRRNLYKLFQWHDSLLIADLGNLVVGAKIEDSYAALTSVLKELNEKNKLAIIIGGSHDNFLAQYYVFKELQKGIEVSVVDSKLDFDNSSLVPEENFLARMLTEDPNYVRHYNHLGFQVYLNHPQLLENMEKLNLEAIRLGKTRENLSNYEPHIRHCNIMSFDMKAMAKAYAPGTAISPNGYTGDEACLLMKYAGMAPHLSSIGIYGYNPSEDWNDITASQIAQMIWYFIDGVYWRKQEQSLTDSDAYITYHLQFDDIPIVFMQSKTTKRWWMKIPNEQFIACSEDDYFLARNNKIPERWFRAQEKL